MLGSLYRITQKLWIIWYDWLRDTLWPAFGGKEYPLDISSGRRLTCIVVRPTFLSYKMPVYHSCGIPHFDASVPASDQKNCPRFDKKKTADTKFVCAIMFLSIKQKFRAIWVLPVYSGVCLCGYLDACSNANCKNLSLKSFYKIFPTESYIRFKFCRPQVGVQASKKSGQTGRT